MSLLSAEGVSVRLGGRQVLDDVTFAVEEGQFTGLIGSNGAGKTTLYRVVLGLLEPNAGQVLVEGRARSRRNPSIGYVPQKIALDPEMPLRARDVVGLGLDGHRFGLPPVLSTSRRRARRDQVDAALAAVGALEFGERRVGRLSGGEQQRVMIAQAIVSGPRLLLLDEPLANLDISSTNDIVAVLASLCRTRGIAILISAHDMNPLLPVMDRIIYMAGGRVATGLTSEVVRTEVLSRLYGHPVEVLEVQGRLLVVGGPAVGDSAVGGGAG